MNEENRKGAGLSGGHGGNNKGGKCGDLRQGKREGHAEYEDMNKKGGETSDMRDEDKKDECCCSGDENTSEECCCSGDESTSEECGCSKDESASDECCCSDDEGINHGHKHGKTHGTYAKKAGQGVVSCRGRIGAHHMQRFMDICMLVLLYKDAHHGYSLAEKLSEFGLDEINVSTMYRTLRKMESEGWIKSNWKAGCQGPRRRIYTITELGKSELSIKAGILKQRRARIEIVLARYEQVIKE